jgi:hypothetical protein
VASVPIAAASGGVVTVNDPTSTINGLSITIPAGALRSNITISISELVPPATLGGVPRFLLKGFSIEPDGTQLSIPATITMPYSVSEFGTNAGIPLESFLGVYFLQTSTGGVQLLNNFSVDKVNHALKGTVAHFSAYSVTNIAELCPPPAGNLDCPDTPPGTPSLAIPCVLLHGFLGGRSTWGQLPSLLTQQGVHAYRFDWDTLSTSFETSAVDLSAALQEIEGLENTSVVNLVAHSFGGILARTYLEGLYNQDVNRAMTLGTPHQGIGGNFSTSVANTCAAIADLAGSPKTCFEVGTGQQTLLAGLLGEGDFLRALNGLTLPRLQSSLTPQYNIITGQRIASGSLIMDDGLITTAGNELCGASPLACSGDSVEEEINPGLCHSLALIGLTCEPGSNIPMADIENVGHPLWAKICSFLGCVPLLGDWAGSATVTDGQRQEIMSASAHISIDQATNSIMATVVFTGPGDVPEIGIATLQMAPPNINLRTTTDNVLDLHNTPGTVRIDRNGVTISGSDQGVPESWSGTLTLSSDGLIMSAKGTTAEGSTTADWNGTLTFSRDGRHLSGNATITSGLALTWSADKQ